MRQILVNLATLPTLEVQYDCTMCNSDRPTKADICLETYNNATTNNALSIRHHNFSDNTQFLCANHAEVMINLEDDNLLIL